MKSFSRLLIIGVFVFSFSSCQKEMESPKVVASMFSVPENAVNGTLVGKLSLSNQDPDLDYIYKIIGGNSDNIFAIDTLSGVITLNDYSKLNFEINPIYNLHVEVTIFKHPNKADLESITINVTDVDMAPTISSTSFSIPENSIKGRVVGSLTFSGVDKRFSYAYVLTGGNTANTFYVDHNTGKIYVNTKNREYIDYETASSFSLKFKVYLYGQQEDEYSENTVNISITDVPDANEDLILYYKFNGNGYDETGNSDCSVGSATFTSDPLYPGFNVLSLNGSGYADINTAFDYSQRSLSVWFKATSITENMTVIFNNDNPFDNYGLSSLAVKEISGIDNLEFNYSGVSFYTPISVNTWYHAVAIFDNLSCKYYLNDQIVYSGMASSYVNSSDGYTNGVIGANRYFDRKFSGNIRQVRLYRKALTADEVHSLYTE